MFWPITWLWLWVCDWPNIDDVTHLGMQLVYSLVFVLWAQRDLSQIELLMMLFYSWRHVTCSLLSEITCQNKVYYSDWTRENTWHDVTSVKTSLKVVIIIFQGTKDGHTIYDFESQWPMQLSQHCLQFVSLCNEKPKLWTFTNNINSYWDLFLSKFI